MNKSLPILALKSRGLKASRKIALTAAFALITLFSFAQVAGDYRSVASGNWNSLATWEVYNGATWVAATSYPGQSANTQTVTIQAGTVVSLNVNVTAFTIGDLVIIGTGRLNLTGTTTWELNALAVHVVPDGVYTGPNFTFAGSQAALRLPANSFISYTPGYGAFPTSNAAPNGSCNNNNALFLGGGSFGLPEVKYSACNGGGNVCVIFSEINDAGGTVNVIPEIELASDVLGAGNQACVNSFIASIRIKGVIDNGQVSLSLGVTPSGSVSPTTFTNLTDGGAGDLGPAGDQQILVQVTVNTPGPGAYTLNASATLTLIASSGSCTNFTTTTSSSASFTVLPTPSITIDAPTGICIGEIGAIALTNNSTIATTVYYNLDGGGVLTVPLAASGSGSISIPNALPASLTYTIDSIAYNTSPRCKQDIDSVLSISVGDATTLANDGDTKTQNIVLAPTVTASQACRLIAKVEKTAGTFTTVNTEAYVDLPYVEYNTRPFVGRRIMISPVSGTATADVTLYAYTSEFVAFNNHPSNGIDLPYTDADPEGYASNIRVISFGPGFYNAVTGEPTGGSPTEYIPTSVVFNATKGWWEIKVSGVDPTGLFVISNTTFVVLPLKLLSFDAQLSGKRTAVLSWKTTEERNLKAFEIEASKDGSLFNRVGEVEARNSVAGGTYSFNTAMPGKLGYFRLRMVDKNGAFSYSPIKSLKTEDLIITSYPNPVKDQMTVDLTGYPSGMMRIVDMSGRTLSTIKSVDGLNRINTSSLGTGMYILQISVGLETEKVKFSKVQ